MYLYELAHRTKVGSNFIGRFYIKKSGYNPSGVAARDDDEIWWRVVGIITSAAIQFSPDSTVQITADFITTGPLTLRMSNLKRRMLSCKRTPVTYAWIKTAALNCCYSRTFNPELAAHG